MNASSNIALKVPFNEKDQAKSLGARWNSEAKHWYVPQGVDVALFEKWLINTPELIIKPTHAITPKQVSASLKPTTNISRNSAFKVNAFNDDMDAINAELRNVYEQREIEPF